MWWQRVRRSIEPKRQNGPGNGTKPSEVRRMSAKPSFVDLIVDMHLPPVFRSRLEDTLRDLQAQPPHGHPCLGQRRGRFHLTAAFARFRAFLSSSLRVPER